VIESNSREQLSKAIENWARVVSLEQFFAGIEKRVQGLPEEQQPEILKRLALAREFVGTQDPLDFFRSWKTPLERYIPLSMRKSESVEEEDLSVYGKKGKVNDISWLRSIVDKVPVIYRSKRAQFEQHIAEHKNPDLTAVGQLLSSGELNAPLESASKPHVLVRQTASLLRQP
jgi:hypothetical protein